MWQRLQPFAETPVFVTRLIVKVSGEVLEIGARTNFDEGDWGNDLLRNTTPPNDPRMFFVTFPLPTAILLKYILFIYVTKVWCVIVYNFEYINSKQQKYKKNYLWGNPRETFGPFDIICFKLSTPVEILLSEALAAFCASFLVTNLSPWASRRCTERTDLVVKFAEQCSHLNPCAPFSTEWLAMWRFKLHCWKNPEIRERKKIPYWK